MNIHMFFFVLDFSIFAILPSIYCTFRFLFIILMAFIEKNEILQEIRLIQLITGNTVYAVRDTVLKCVLFFFPLH